MALSTFAGLKAAFLDYLSDTSLSTSFQNDCFTLAEARIWYGNEGRDIPFPNAALRARQMITRENMTVDAEFEDLPTLFLAPVKLQISGYKPLDLLTEDQMAFTYSNATSALPRAYSVVGTQYKFGPPPDTSYTVSHTYFAKPAALSADADTNWLMSASPGVYLYGALLEANIFLQDTDEAQKWYGAFVGAINGLNTALMMSKMSSSMQPRTLGNKP